MMVSTLMRMLRPILPVAVLCVAIALVPAAGASAARVAPQPLLRLQPTSVAFISPAPSPSRVVRAATPETAYPTADGQRVAVAFSPGYAPNPTVAAGYVAFLDSLPHGGELSKLHVYIATPAEITTLCGRVDGTLACYSPTTHTMTVPGQEVTTGSGVTTTYIIAHEYGHHVAAFRDNPPFDALDHGPKYWSSLKQVCNLTLNKQLFPGNEGANYRLNPGESWADTYAHLVFPDVPWMFTELLRPDEAAYAAARRDVLTPWTTPVARTFSGRFTKASGNTRTFRFKLRLDGAMSFALKGPAAASYDLALLSGGKVEQRTRAAGSSDRISYPDGACRERTVESISVAVTRRHGNGSFTVRASYAG